MSREYLRGWEAKELLDKDPFLATIMEVVRKAGGSRKSRRMPKPLMEFPEGTKLFFVDRHNGSTEYFLEGVDKNKSDIYRTMMRINPPLMGAL